MMKDDLNQIWLNSAEFRLFSGAHECIKAL